MRVLHVAPTAFGHDGLFGGGERYPLELARALALVDGVRCELVTFGREARVEEHDGLRIHVLRAVGHLGGHPAHPVAPALAAVVRRADVVHTHHLRSLPSRISALLARARRIPVVVTDHGLAGGDWLGLLPHLFNRFLPVSEYSARVLRAPRGRTTVVWGGVDPVRFSPGSCPRHGVLFVGRLTPHKGVDRLIAALPDGARLSIAHAHPPSMPPPPTHADGDHLLFLEGFVVRPLVVDGQRSPRDQGRADHRLPLTRDGDDPRGPLRRPSTTRGRTTKPSRCKEEQIIAVPREWEAEASTAGMSAAGTAPVARQSTSGPQIMAGWIQGPRVYLRSEFRSMRKYRTVVRRSLIVRRAVHQLLKPLRIEDVDFIALAGGDELCLAQLG